MSSPAVSTGVSRHTIQQLLPTCQRCRRLRRKCDTRLPSCLVCDKAGAECTLYDHTLKQALPRAYVQSLLTRVEHLEAVKNGSVGSPGFENDPQLQQAQRPDLGIQSILPIQDAPPTFDVVIPSTKMAGRSRYWGASSIFALTVEIMHHATMNGLAPVEDLTKDVEQEEDRENEVSPFAALQAPDADVQALVHLYLISLNAMYGFVGYTETTSDLQAYLAMRQQPGFSPRALHGEQAHQFFRITMMCAISCANQARYRNHRNAECLGFYAAALLCVEEVTSEASPASLQALLLLIVFYLFHPRKGDIWKLLDYACRLTIELGYHTEAEHDQTVSIEAESEAQSKLRRSTFWGLYAIERIVGQLFGRGSDLPETIITTKYPSSLHMNIMGVSPMSGSGVDQPTVQSMSIAHHYRLVYLRSEIFRVMYLPASPPDLGLDWLREQYATLYAWRRELAVSDDLEGVATLTCDVGYDATICFLFQPLLLKALRATATPREMNGGYEKEEESPGQQNEILVASDAFHSAINLIYTYEKIIRASENSILGTYPMTFLSAHYIYLASSTLLAQGLLRLDGRAHFLPCMSAGEGTGENDGGELDWGMFIDVSSSCLILLSWCSERWPGMLGMLKLYQDLFRQVIKGLITKKVI